MCSSFLTNTCLTLAVMTLDYFPNQGDCSVVLAVNFEQVLSFDYYLYFPHFFLSSLFLLCTILFFITIVSKIISIKVVIISVLLVYPESLLFVPSTRWWACSCQRRKHFIVYFSSLVNYFEQIYSAS